ncbi:MAG: hypothetical protein JWO69_964 [Thermoleophilia bacterium]|nr:hypothetical protein [Thermoleophilia bacterium]
MSDSWARVDRRVERLLARRSSRSADHDLASVLRVFAAAARTGVGIGASFDRAAGRVAGRVGEACRLASADLRIGRGIEMSLARFAARVDTASARLFAQVVCIQHRRGGSLAEPCHRLGALLQERARLQTEARTATAQARFSARAVIAIPVVLAVLAAWRSPDTARSFLQPGMLLLAAPGVLLIALGGVVATRVARRAADMGDPASSPPARPGRLGAALRRIAGQGPRSRGAVRLVGAALAVGAPFLVSAGLTVVGIASLLLLLAAAASWPWVEHRRAATRSEQVAQAGVDLVLEVSIALFAAGATAQEVASAAPLAAPEPLRSALEPAVHRMRLGRGISSAFADLPEVAASPQLDGWLHAVCTSAELGVPATTVLEGHLRDARVARREQLRTAAQTAAPRMQLALVLLVVPGVMWIMLLATVGGLLGQLRASGVL